MTSHLLCLADLEATAPGILKVIFGADGDFKNAPPFAGPVSVIKAQPDLMAGGYLWIHGGLTADGIWDGAGRLTPFDAVALDCRVPGVAARLAGLCAHALAAQSDGGLIVYMDAAGTYPFRGWVGARSHNGCLRFDLHGHFLRNNSTYGGLYALEPKEEFLAALVRSISPRIAALKTP